MKTLTLTTALTATLLTTPAVADPQDWQERRLFEPTSTQRVAELKGHITIYDGLHEGVVNRALDSQFGRIENMMFVRTKHTAPDGDELVEDDGC